MKAIYKKSGCLTHYYKVLLVAAVLYGIAGVLEAARTAGATNNYGNSYRICGRENPLF